MDVGALVNFNNIHLPAELCCSIGVICAVASAVSTVVGMLLQKAGHDGEDKVVFYLGVLIFSVLKPATQFAALYFAPISLIAPLASISILLNALITPYLQHSAPGRWDLLASVILMAGCIGSISTGAHHAEFWSYDELVTLGMESVWLTSALVITVLLLSVLMLVAKRNSKERELSIIAVALLPSTASALNNVMVKVLLEAFFFSTLVATHGDVGLCWRNRVSTGLVNNSRC
jgi:drug/metabolite transporter (DMT)-like permease